MHDFTFKAIEFETAFEAIQHTDAAGGEAILLLARNFVVTKDEAIRIGAAGIEFAYLVFDETRELADGSFPIVTIPVN